MECNTGFIYNYLTEVEEQVNQPSLDYACKKSEIFGINEWLHTKIKSAENDLNNPFTKVLNVKVASHLWFKIILYILPSLFSKKTFVFVLDDAYVFTTYKPNLYKLVSDIQGSCKSKVSEIELIDVHIRFANFAQFTERYLDPNFYYLTLDRVIADLERRGKKYQIRVHSDFNLDLQNANLNNMTNETLKHYRDLGILNENYLFNLNNLTLAKFTLNQLLTKYNNIEFCNNETALDALKSMVTSDTLILSKSSFAFVAGILNTDGQIYTPEYWNKAPSNWITS